MAPLGVIGLSIERETGRGSAVRELQWNPELRRIEIRFSYDKQLVDLVRGLSGRRWHPEEKIWTVPRESLEETAHRLLPLGFSPSAAVKEFLESGAASPADEGEGRSPEIPKALDGEAPRAGRGRGSREKFVQAVAPLSAVRGDLVAESSASDPSPVGEVPPEETWTVSALNERVRALLRSRMSAPFWVVGEIVGFDRNAHKSHVFFTLVEKEEGDDRARASVTTVLFAQTRNYVEKTFAEAGGGLALCDGIRVRFQVSVDLYPVTGSYQLIVEAIDPTFTLGEIALRQERILREVTQAGLAERNRSLSFPTPPLRVGLITSWGSDAYNDFLSELERSGFAFHVHVADVHVQGERLESEVLRALAQFERGKEQFDVLVISRGGGSRTDLMGFDTIDLALAVARHPLKVVIGIGHQQDRSVLDLIAHSEKTPTAAAALLVSLCEDAEDQLAHAAERLSQRLGNVIARERARDSVWRERARSGLRRRLSLEREFLTRAGGRIPRWGKQVIGREWRAQGDRIESLPRRVRRALRRARARQVEQARRWNSVVPIRLAQARGGLESNSAELSRLAHRVIEEAKARWERARLDTIRRSAGPLREARGRLDALTQRIAAHDPREVLARGYSWLRREDGSTVRSVKDVDRGETMRAEVSDGVIEAEVKRSLPSGEKRESDE